MEGSRKELEARIDFFNSITGEVFTRLDEIRSMGEIQFIRELAGESKEDLQKKLLCFRRFYDSGEGEKISKYLFRKEGGRVINYLNSSFHKS